MAKGKQSTPKTAKPKPVSEVKVTVHDNGQITADFYVWEPNEVGSRKKWTVSGADFCQFLNRLQPNNIPVIASLMNVQIVNAGLPEDRQGPWLSRGKDGVLSISENSPGSATALPALEESVPTGEGPGSDGKGEQAAVAHENEAASAVAEG